MPTFNDPSADAAEARQALRGLAHASRRIDNPDELYGIVGELLGATRSLEQSLIQLGGASLTHQTRATHDDGDRNLGAADAWAAADALQQAARHVSASETLLDQASGHLGRIAWDPPQRDRTGPAQDAATADAAQQALDERRNRVRGDGSWFTPDRIADIKRNRGLER
ncbi:hypothetical protein [Gordonia phthalatica]|uniref:hypothetical protein n=1 Tax=Gordonia phthalatica TaxID=1136941 RepID=UPI00078317F6|nr:hypothetical protein [Gordonia phthalatica]